MTWCKVKVGDWGGPTVTLSPEESHHLARVLRCRLGESVVLFDGRGRVAEAEVVRVDPHGTVARVGRVREVPPPAAPATLVQALPKARKMDVIVQKATELGVDSVVPMATEQAVVRHGTNTRRQRGF